MSANVYVNFEALKAQHPNYDKIKVLGTGAVLDAIKKGWETCCIQVSYALNHAGGMITGYSQYYNGEMGRTVRALQGGDNMNYVFEVSDMKTYLNGRYGTAENYPFGTKDKMIENIKGRQGILALGHRHIDLWSGKPADNGKYYFHNERPDGLGYLGYVDLWVVSGANPSIGIRGIFFWEVTSEWGF